MMGLLAPLLIVVIFYTLVLLPMQRQKKKQQQMLGALKNGDTVVTNGGIVGTIFSINTEDDTLILRVRPDNVRLQVSRSSVAARVSE